MQPYLFALLQYSLGELRLKKRVSTGEGDTATGCFNEPGVAPDLFHNILHRALFATTFE